MTVNVLGSLVITFSVLLICSKVISGCTRGFIELDLLRRRAEATGGAGNFLREEFRLLPNDSFSCNGTLTGLLLVGDIRANQVMRNQYPEIQIWRNTGGNNYTRLASEEIRLNQGSFSPDGVLQYNLNTSIPFQSGDVLGLYQPKQQNSIVRVYYDSSASTSYQVMGANPTSSITIPNSLSTTITDELILISPISDSPSCTSNFLSHSALRQGALNVNINTVMIRDNQQRLFPDITFTCNGSITNWIVGASVGLGVLFPELQIWRNTGGTSYSKAMFSQISNVTVINNVAEFTPNPPLEFQEGDILGVYQPVSTDSALVVYYQVSDGPVNYEEGNSPLSTVTLDIPHNQYDYPLVTVEINTGIPGIVSSTASAPLSDTAMPASSRDGVLSDTATILTSATPTSMFPTDRSSNSTPAIVAAVVAVLVVVMLVAVSAAIVILIVLRRKKKTKEATITTVHYTSDQIEEAKDLGNSLSLEVTATDSTKPIMELYTPVDACNYETPLDSEPRSQITFYEQPATPAQLQQASLSVESPLYQWGIVVPTLSQRKNFTDPEGHYEFNEEIYSSITQDEQYQDLNHSFFEESVIYWEPGSDCGAIYEQLADKRYREIVRQHIKIGEHLGSGQFGLVEKGVWTSPDGPVDVAIKTLKNEASEVEKIKFLQEAAIMGQFHHANIVTLHGVVTVAEPTMIVLELVKNGDLREYLHTLRPTPGELAPSSLPQQLLGYCRQIASGMKYLSKKNFVHRDLAARNILVDDKLTCKIADFGMSRDLSDCEYYVSHGGKVPVKWTAPEAVNFNKYSTASDVWSFGALMYEIWSLGHKPFARVTNPEAIKLIDTGYRLPPPPGCPRAVYQLMMDCWHPEASGRLSFSIVLSRLSQPDNQLLKWTDTMTNDPQSTMLGAPLETASNLHFDLQQQYR